MNKNISLVSSLMNDICAIIIPKKSNPSEILLVDMYDMIDLTTPSNQTTQISFMDKLTLVNAINNDHVCKENSCKCAFLPFFSLKNLSYDDGKSLTLKLLKKIVSPPPPIIGYVYFSKRFIVENFFSYNVIIYFTGPIDTQQLKIGNCFWIDKENLKVFHNIYDYYNIGNELENIFPLKAPNQYQITNETNLYEYKLNPISTKIVNRSDKNSSLLQQIVAETNTDLYVQNYVFADFMTNSYPSQVMCYPQFIGFAVARGLYPKRLKRIFKVLSEPHEMYLTFENFLFGCICMDLSSEHVNMTRVARAGLIFKYFDKNDNDRLDFKELNCLVKRMRKKMGYTENADEVRQATKKIMGLLNKTSTSTSIEQQNITFADFVKGLHYPELWGLTFLLRFSLPYLIKTRYLMGQYIENSQIVLLREMKFSESGLIPYFIKEAYSTEDLFKNMVYYSKSYENMQDLLKKMEDKNKIAITKFKTFNILSNFFGQIFYYLSELAFDIYNSEGLFPLRNPLFLTLIMTGLAIVYPTLFVNSSLLWKQIFSYFTTGLPTLIYATKKYTGKSIENLPESYRENKSKEIAEKSNHWLVHRDKTIKRENEIKLSELENVTSSPRKLNKNETKDFFSGKFSLDRIFNYNKTEKTPFDLKENLSPNKNVQKRVNEDEISAFEKTKKQISNNKDRLEKSDNLVKLENGFKTNSEVVQSEIKTESPNQSINRKESEVNKFEFDKNQSKKSNEKDISAFTEKLPKQSKNNIINDNEKLFIKSLDDKNATKPNDLQKQSNKNLLGNIDVKENINETKNQNKDISTYGKLVKQSSNEKTNLNQKENLEWKSNIKENITDKNFQLTKPEIKNSSEYNKNSTKPTNEIVKPNENLKTETHTQNKSAELNKIIQNQPSAGKEESKLEITLKKKFDFQENSQYKSDKQNLGKDSENSRNKANTNQYLKNRENTEFKAFVDIKRSNDSVNKNEQQQKKNEDNNALKDKLSIKTKTEINSKSQSEISNRINNTKINADQSTKNDTIKTPEINVDISVYSNDKKSSYWESDIQSQSKDKANSKLKVDFSMKSNDKRRHEVDFDVSSRSDDKSCTKSKVSNESKYTKSSDLSNQSDKNLKNFDSHEDLQSPYFETDISKASKSDLLVESGTPSVTSKITEESKCTQHVCKNSMKNERKESGNYHCEFKGCRNSSN